MALRTILPTYFQRKALFELSRVNHRHRIHVCEIGTTSTTNKDLDPSVSPKVQKYSQYQPSPVSIAHFLDFGINASLESSFMFLRREVPVRLANIMKELNLMPHELRQTQACSLIVSQYAQSFEEITAFEKLNPNDKEVLELFTRVLFGIRERHASTVPIMAEAVMEVKSHYDGTNGQNRLPKFGRNIQYFLDRLYTSRISTRMLINQHTMLFAHPDQVESKLSNTVDGQKSMIGSIDPKCEVGDIVFQAYDNARFLCEQYYMMAPDLIYESFDSSIHPGDAELKGPNKVFVGNIGKKYINRQDPISFVYVPSHLYHILFELFKNAMRATIEQAGADATSLPPIEVFAVKAKEDVTIQIHDRGGGIPRRLIKTIFQYLYTTASPVLTASHEVRDLGSMSSMTGTVPLAGYGYGLPLSRLYARYFNGDLEIYSSEGWGTNAVVYLHALAGEAKERLPVYHETGSKKIYEAQLAASDWTSNIQGSDPNSS